MIAVRLLWPVVSVAARRELAARYDRATARAIVVAAWDGYVARSGDIAPDASGSGRLMVHLAALSASLYHALRDRGPKEEKARYMVAGVTWRVYGKMARVPAGVAVLCGGATRERIRKATELFRRYPFGPPAYDMVGADAGPEVVAFDVRRCAVADHLRAQGFDELCAVAWCDLDHRLAERWGARLHRGGTLARGAPCCDFRWRVAPIPVAVPGDEDRSRGA